MTSSHLWVTGSGISHERERESPVISPMAAARASTDDYFRPVQRCASQQQWTEGIHAPRLVIQGWGYSINYRTARMSMSRVKHLLAFPSLSGLLALVPTYRKQYTCALTRTLSFTWGPSHELSCQVYVGRLGIDSDDHSG